MLNVELGAAAHSTFNIKHSTFPAPRPPLPSGRPPPLQRRRRLDARPPRGPAIDAGDRRAGVLLNRPEVDVVDRIDSRRAVVAPAVAAGGADANVRRLALLEDHGPGRTTVAVEKSEGGGGGRGGAEARESDQRLVARSEERRVGKDGR